MSEIAATPGALPEEGEETIIVRRRRNWPVTIAKVVLGLIVGLALLVGLLFAFINTDPGLRVTLAFPQAPGRHPAGTDQAPQG